MSSGVRDIGVEAAKTRGDAGDEPRSQSKSDAVCTPGNALEGDPTPDADRTWDISDWFRIS
jgi:hypothetical protein